jgi:DNA-binding HxlR family transcriptional regulator
MLEHMSHAGQENGRLMATYDQLVQFGIPRKLIRSSIFELEELGFVVREVKGGRDFASLYRITFLGEGSSMPSNEWERLSKSEARAIANQARAVRIKARGAPKRMNSVPHAGTSQPPNAGTVIGSHSGNFFNILGAV